MISWHLPYACIFEYSNVCVSTFQPIETTQYHFFWSRIMVGLFMKLIKKRSRESEGHVVMSAVPHLFHCLDTEMQRCNKIMHSCSATYAYKLISSRSSVFCRVRFTKIDWELSHKNISESTSIPILNVNKRGQCP